MQVIYERCCGLAVPKKRGVACVITPEAQQTRTFTAMTQDLLALSDWLMEHRVTHVAMESTAQGVEGTGPPPPQSHPTTLPCSQSYPEGSGGGQHQVEGSGQQRDRRFRASHAGSHDKGEG
jgi:hypothetical protein